MILQALYDLAKFEDLAGDLDFQYVPVAFRVELNEQGKFLGVISRKYLPETDGKKKPKVVSPPLKVPVQTIRTSGVSGQFFVDNAMYVFGLAPPDKNTKPERVKQCAEAFREQVAACAEATGDAGACAVRTFLDDVAADRQTMAWDEEWQSNDLFAFTLSSEPDIPVHLRPKVQEYWRGIRNETTDTSEDSARCLVTGKPVTSPALFPLIKKLPGGGTMGTSLVSFNAPAFLSQGWKNNENAPLSREASETCATALNRLLHPAYPDPHEEGLTLPPRRYVLTSDTVVVFWSPEAGGQKGCEALPFFVEVENPPEEVKALYESVWRGRKPKLENPAAFYAMTLTGTTGRAIVRDWLESTVGRVLDNMADYFDDIAMVRNCPKPKKRDFPPAMPLKMLLRSLAVNGDTDRLPPNLAAAIFHAAVSGAPFPRQVLQRALERARAESSKTEWLDLERRDGRAALVKAFLNRQRRHFAGAASRYREVTRKMDPNNDNPGYLLGRLMAVLERLQQQALGDVNATVVDRYFKRAVAAPRSVFAHLLKLRQSHERKLKRDKPGANVFLQKRIDGLLAQLPATENFPRSLDMESQGLFLLGYHHERHWLWMDKAAREEWAREQGVETAVVEETTVAAD